MTRNELLAEADAKVTHYRAEVARTRPGSPKWREANEDLNFWIGRRSMIPATN